MMRNVLKFLLTLAIYFAAPRESFWRDVNRLEDPGLEDEIALIKSVPAHYAGAYTEFYCDPSSGSNLNGGSDAGSPSMSDTGSFAGSVSTVTHQYTSVATTGTVTVGQFISIFATGATTPAFCSRITAVSGGSGSVWVITYSTTVKFGTEPTTGSTYEAIVGGAWQGPTGANAWPVGSLNNAMTNSSANPVRCNMKNNATYAITVGVTQNKPGVTYQGYTSSVGDGGKANIDGSTNAIVLWTCSSTLAYTIDLIFSNNGTTGTNAGVSVSNTGNVVRRCVAHNIRGFGFSSSQGGTLFDECEAYLCNGAGSNNQGGFGTAVDAFYYRCISHDHSGANGHGFVGSGVSSSLALEMIQCISDSNGGIGAKATSVSGIKAYNCDFYNNGGSGIDVSAQTTSCCFAVNCNFLKNTGNGVTGAASETVASIVDNCGFGSGTMANAATTSGTSVQELNSVTYASGVTPWVDPANGDFRINLAAAIGTGVGSFTQSTPMTGAVTGATNATPIVITAASRTMRTGETVTIASVGGNTAANGTWTVTKVSASTFSLNGSTGNGTYTAATGTYSCGYTGASGNPVIGSNQVADYPTVGNVNNGTNYANGAYTGTLAGGGTTPCYASCG